MRITSKGQVTIPVAMRERTGLLPNTDVEFVLEGKTVRIARAKKRGKRTASRGESVVRTLRSRPTLGMSTDDIMGLMRPR